MKKSIFIFLLLMLWIPYLQDKLVLFEMKPLSGVSTPTEKPVFNSEEWLEGIYQNNYNEHIDETFGLRNYFIRLYNQLDFLLFKKPHGEVTIGKDYYLFQDGYIDEVTGRNYIGGVAMQRNINDIRTIEKYLNDKNISLITVLAPGKTDYYKEYLPEYYNNKLSAKRNYNALLKYAAQKNIKLIDLNNWFLQLKDTTRYPLFPRQGIHWSYYGMALSVDTITKYIQQQNKIRLQKFSWDLEHPESLRGTDYDLGELLNINEVLPYNKQAYPKFKFTEDSTAARPRLLVIGDSFYWTIFNEGVFGKLFSNETFYYYCSSIYPKDRSLSNITSDLNILKEIEKYDIILLIQSSANYGNPGVNFIQTIMNELNRREEYRIKVTDEIAVNPSFQDRITELSGGLDISKDSSVSILADSLTEFRFEEISKTKIQMRNNKEWLKQLYEKSYSGDKSIDQVMQSDAEWLVDNSIKLFR